MALFEGGQFNPEALGPLQNMFNKNQPIDTSQIKDEDWQNDYKTVDEYVAANEPKKPFQAIGQTIGNFFSNKDNGKSKQPLINKEDQTMRLPNFLFPKKHEKSILNIPGKVFNENTIPNLQKFGENVESFGKKHFGKDSPLMSYLAKHQKNKSTFRQPLAHDASDYKTLLSKDPSADEVQNLLLGGDETPSNVHSGFTYMPPIQHKKDLKRYVKEDITNITDENPKAPLLSLLNQNNEDVSDTIQEYNTSNTSNTSEDLWANIYNQTDEYGAKIGGLPSMDESKRLFGLQNRFDAPDEWAQWYGNLPDSIKQKLGGGPRMSAP